MKKILFLLFISVSINVTAQVSVGGYVDTYYAYNFNKPGKDQPYFVSMARNNEVNINLAYIDLKYSSDLIRARLVPGFGTYMNSNYSAERSTLRNIVEGSVGVKLSRSKNIWVDAGVFGSPYTNESAVSKDHLAYTRSFAAEYVPYYLAGVKLTAPLSPKINAYVYLLNGWQQIEDSNEKLSVGTQIEYKPNDELLLNWDTYIGEERTAADTTLGTRYFTDFYLVYNKNRVSITSCFYIGTQQDRTWWQANIIGRYNLTGKLSVTARMEHFNDPRSVQIVPVTSVEGFRTSGSSLGFNYKLTDNALFRIEGRTLFSDKDVFVRDNIPVNNSTVVTSNLTVWF